MSKDVLTLNANKDFTNLGINQEKKLSFLQ